MSNTNLIPADIIEQRIFFIRGQKVILDVHLAQLYGVPTKRLKEQVRRNDKRFPADFMFELNKKEFKFLRSHFATSKVARGGARYRSFAFTEQGVAMLSSVLNSVRSIEVNIGIMRAFVKLRKVLATHKDLARKFDELEKKYDGQFQIVFQAIRQLMKVEAKPKRPIGFQVEEQSIQYKIKR